MEENKNIRIKDIAKMAGVSVGTVDRVLHNRGKVSDDARKKVEEVLSRTGYQPNLLARTLGSNKQFKVVALIPDPSLDEYWMLANEGVKLASEEWIQYGVEVSPKYFDLYHSELFSKVAKEVTEEGADGILIAPIFHQESQALFDELKELEIPYVLFNSNIPEADALSFIGQNLYQSGCLAGELLDLGGTGKKQIAMLHVLEDVANSVHLKAKEDGLRNYFEQNTNQEYEIISLNLNEPDEEKLKSKMLHLLDSNSLQGIFISTSKGTNIAASFIAESDHQHIRLVGYDLLEKNIEMLKQGTIDFLINQNPKRQAQIGISFLANFVLFKKEPPKEDLFPLEIITRQNLNSYMESRIH